MQSVETTTLHVLETHSSSGPNARSRFLDAVEKPRVVLETVIEPVVTADVILTPSAEVKLTPS